MLFCTLLFSNVFFLRLFKVKECIKYLHHYGLNQQHLQITKIDSHLIQQSMKMVGFLFLMLVSFINQSFNSLFLFSLLVVQSKVTSPNDDDDNNIMTNSWIASPPLRRTDQSPSINRSLSPNTHHFNPIENLLIEHASMRKMRKNKIDIDRCCLGMSVYEQIASQARPRRHRKAVNDIKLDEQVEEIKTDDDDRSSVVLQVRLSIYFNRTLY